MTYKPDQIISHAGDTWRILALGAQQAGYVFAHLASTTRGRQQRNGWVPVQSCDWLATDAATGEPPRHPHH